MLHADVLTLLSAARLGRRPLQNGGYTAARSKLGCSQGEELGIRYPHAEDSAPLLGKQSFDIVGWLSASGIKYPVQHILYPASRLPTRFPCYLTLQASIEL